MPLVSWSWCHSRGPLRAGTISSEGMDCSGALQIPHLAGLPLHTAKGERGIQWPTPGVGFVVGLIQVIN